MLPKLAAVIAPLAPLPLPDRVHLRVLHSRDACARHSPPSRSIRAATEHLIVVLDQADRRMVLQTAAAFIPLARLSH